MLTVKDISPKSFAVEGSNVVQTPAAQPQTPSGFKPYTVRIAASALNVRKGPGADTDVVKTLLNDNGVYTIVEEAKGSGASVWCKLQEALGWISGDFVKRQ